MRFRIARHSGHAAPPDAMELLMRRLGAQCDDVSFAMAGAEIRARVGDDEGDPATRETRAEAARWQVFELVRDVCERAPELKTEWYAVSYVP